MTTSPAAHLFTAPVHADVNLTNGCDMHCAHCHSSSGPGGRGELTTTELHVVIGALHRMGTMSVLFAGGEPFLRKDTVDLLAHACSLPGWQVGVVTNGLALTRPAFTAELQARCPGLVVNVSIEGSTPVENALLRHHRRTNAESLFRQTCEAIRLAVTAGLATSCNITLHKKSAATIPTFYDYATRVLGASSVIAIKFVPIGFGAQSRQALEFTFEEWAASFTELTRLRFSGGLPHLRLSVPAAWDFYLPLILEGMDISRAEAAWGYRAPLLSSPSWYGARTIGDPAGVGELAVGPTGDVYPTILLVGNRRAVCGNVRDADINTLWHRSQLLSLLRHAQVADLHGWCPSCEVRRVCGGGSRARADALTGDLLGADLSCPVAKPKDADQQRPVLLRGPSAEPVAGAEPVPEPETLLVLGHGKTALRLIRYGMQYELRGQWQVTKLSEAEAVRLQETGDPTSLAVDGQGLSTSLVFALAKESPHA